jgi:hypothetical protein
MSLDSEVYVRLLLPKRLGFPLWNPTPDSNLPAEYRNQGVSIGDVGIITSDRFDFLFNICVPHDHPINNVVYGVPTDFENISDVTPPLQISMEKDFHTRPTTIASTLKKSKDLGISVASQDNPYASPLI